MKTRSGIVVTFTPREMERLYLEVESLDMKVGEVIDKDFPTLSKLLTKLHLAYYGEPDGCAGDARAREVGGRKWMT